MRWVFWFFFFKQKTAYEMRISDWSSDVCSSDLLADYQTPTGRPARRLLDAQVAAASAAEDARATQAELEQFDSVLERLEAKRNEQRRLVAELDDPEQQQKLTQLEADLDRARTAGQALRTAEALRREAAHGRTACRERG